MSRVALLRRFCQVGAALAILSLVADVGGCVERRMTIRSNPPGAAVYVDDYQIGTTPVAVDYTYYGTRKIRLVKDGFETLTLNQPMPPPWYDYFGIDFFSENLWPGKIRDERAYDYQMTPQVLVSGDQLLNRAEQLRTNGRVMQAGAVQPIVLAPPPTMAPAEVVPAPGTLPPGTAVPQTLPPPQQYQPAPGTMIPPNSSIPTYAPPAGSGSMPTYPAQGGTVYPPPGSAAPTYTPPPNAGPSFSSPGGFGVGGAGPSMGPNGSPMPLFPESAPGASPQYVPPTAPYSAPPPAAAPALPAVPPYSVPPGWHPMGQLPATDGAVTR